MNNKLQEYIEEHGIKQSWLARKLRLASRSDFHNRMIGRMDARGYRIRFTEAQRARIAELLGVDQDELFGEKR